MIFLSVDFARKYQLSGWVWLFFCWTCAKFSWQQKSILTNQFGPWLKIYGMEHLFAIYVRKIYIMEYTMERTKRTEINRSNQSESTKGLESRPSFWTRHFKRSVKPRQSWLTPRTDGNIKSWECWRRRLLQANSASRYLFPKASVQNQVKLELNAGKSETKVYYIISPCLMSSHYVHNFCPSCWNWKKLIFFDRIY